jgi:hypothetical protein
LLKLLLNVTKYFQRFLIKPDHYMRIKDVKLASDVCSALFMYTLLI